MLLGFKTEAIELLGYIRRVKDCRAVRVPSDAWNAKGTRSPTSSELGIQVNTPVSVLKVMPEGRVAGVSN